MIGYIIGIVLGVIVFILQNFKPTSFGFRIMFLLVTIAFIWGIFYAHLGYWNILVVPLGVLVLCFISAFCFPYNGNSASMEYRAVNGANYYEWLQDQDQIGKISPRGFKQTYDRIMSGILFEIVNNQKDMQEFGSLLYSKNFYPVSIHTKKEILNHINTCIEQMANSSKQGDTIRAKANERIEQLFNTYVSVMAIHEEATRNIEEIEKRRNEDDADSK